METFSFQLEEWSMDNNMVSKIWVGMSTINIHLLQFKIQSHLQKCRYIRNHSEEKCLELLALHSSFCPIIINIIPYQKGHLVKFSSKYFNYTAILSTLETTSRDETIRSASKWFIQTQRTRNLQSVNLKCVTYHAYTQPIPLPLNSFQLEMLQVGKVIDKLEAQRNATLDVPLIYPSPGIQEVIRTSFLVYPWL